MPQNKLLIPALVMAFVLGIFATRWFFGKTEHRTDDSSTVLLEKIEAVKKLVTVEGYFSEVYSHKDYAGGYDTWFTTKKALIRVKAKVSAGYDLGKMTLVPDNSARVIRMSNLPQPTILSIDHTLDYYDITEGIFNSFTPEDLSRLNASAKNYIQAQAEKSSLMESARKEGNQVLDMIRVMVESAGWRLVVEGMAPAAKDSLRK